MKNILLIILVLSLAGCSKAGLLLAAKRVGDEQVAIDKLVEKQTARFIEMKELYQSGQFDKFDHKNKIQRKFGKPLFVDVVVENNQTLELWMYRKPVEFKNTDRIYLYFDKKGQLVNSKFEEAKDGKEKT